MNTHWVRFVFVVGLVGGHLVSITGCVHHLYKPTERANETLWATTPDGWRLALHHFIPPIQATKRNHPVLVCHGISSNKYNWDLTDRLSFPYYLAKQGFDTWAVELRASGSSQPPKNSENELWNYSFDDYVLLDVPTLVETVLKHTKQTKVHWVGHSMGGIVLYGYLQRVRQDTIQSATVVGSPPYILDHNQNLLRVAENAHGLAKRFRMLPNKTATQLGAPLAAAPFLDEMRLVWNYDNLQPDVARLAAANAVSNLSSNIVMQILNHGRAGPIVSQDNQHNYTSAMNRIRVPIFFVAGALDQLAPPAVLMYGYRSVASVDKRLEVLGKANGYRADYGHMDMCIGKHAPEEVFGLLGDWIVDHDGR